FQQGKPRIDQNWGQVGPTLGQNHPVSLRDWRGYWDMDKPTSDAAQRTYSMRTMAKDIVMLMDALGVSRFAFVGHDRGGRVVHSLALDYPDRVTCCTFIDIAPTATMYVFTDKSFASLYLWLFVLITPFP
ncbi:alpha/beta fold hydrolase, partial [Salmonella enterica]|uniref:alpha/beta fold hydrolase n=1 Tax=Salmonella enterica TaxID=28901 RepID=UPI00398C344F